MNIKYIKPIEVAVMPSTITESQVNIKTSILNYGEEMYHKSKTYQEKNRGGEGENENIYKQWYVHFGMRYHGV